VLLTLAAPAFPARFLNMLRCLYLHERNPLPISAFTPTPTRHYQLSLSNCLNVDLGRFFGLEGLRLLIH
jgi:hypothetical protein